MARWLIQRRLSQNAAQTQTRLHAELAQVDEQIHQFNDDADDTALRALDVGDARRGEGGERGAQARRWRWLEASPARRRFRSPSSRREQDELLDDSSPEADDRSEAAAQLR